MTARVTRFFRWIAIAWVASIAACGGASGTGTVPAAPQPSSPLAGSTTQIVPNDGMVLFPIAAHLGVAGTISLPVVPGAGGTGTLLYSTTAIPDLPELTGPPLAPHLVEYLCVSFSVHQIPISPPEVALTIVPTAGPTSGVGLAYFQVPSNSWNQTFGVAKSAPAVTLVARDAVFYRPDRTCFALFLTTVTPLP
jgi:hypothetical protein